MRWRGALALVMLSCLLFAGYESASAQQPVTGVARWSVVSEQMSAWSPVELLRFSFAKGEEDTAELRLVWREDSSGWFTTWGLYLEGDPIFFPEGTGSFEEGVGVRLDLRSHLFPAAGRDYEFAAAYDPVSGVLSIRGQNKTDDHVPFLKQVRLSPLTEDYRATIHATDTLDAAFRLRESSWVSYFVPVGLEARLTTRPSRPAGIDPRKAPEASVVLTHLPTPIEGRFELTLSPFHDEGIESDAVLIWRSEASYPAEATFPTASLPTEASSLRLAFIGPDGERWTLATFGAMRRMLPDEFALVPWNDPTLDRPIRTLTFEIGPPRRDWRTMDAFAGWEVSSLDSIRQSALLIAYQHGFTTGLAATGIDWVPDTEYHLRLQSVPLTPIRLKAALVSSSCPALEEVRELEPVHDVDPVAWTTFAFNTGACADYELRLSVAPSAYAEAAWGELLVESIVIAKAGARWDFRNFDEKDLWVTAEGSRASIVPKGTPGTGEYAGRVAGGDEYATLTNPSLPILPNSTYVLSFRTRILQVGVAALSVKVESPSETAQGLSPRLDESVRAPFLWETATLEFQTGPYEDYRLMFERPAQFGEVLIDEILLVRKEE